MTPIRPEFLAAKIQAARNGDPEASAFAEQLATQPRLLETLWLIQEMSRPPGGTPRFVDQLIEASPDRFQSKSMQAAGPPRKGRYTLAQCWQAWKDFDEHSAREWREDKPDREPDELGLVDWLSFFFDPARPCRSAEGDTEVRKGVDRFNWPFLRELCFAAARNKLPRLLSDWCDEKSVACYGPWYCPDLLPTLFDFMDRHAAEAARELAQTEIAKTVFRELEFARSQCVPVPIVGASRFGKTKAVSVWAEMRPGLARLVTVPDSNRERDFFAAHADAFGIGYGPGTTAAELKRQVEFVHRHSGIFLVYDEASFLIPASYHKATPPRRLNWVRCQVIDRGLGCAFFATPQSYRETLDAYVKKTGYCMEQWLGRMAPPVVLPESLDSADVLAVARNHFPDVPEPYLKLISARAMQSEGYLKNVEICVKRARFLAGEHGRRAPTLADVQTAIGYTMPAMPPVNTTASVPARRRTPAIVSPPGRGASAMPSQAGPQAEFPHRGTLPKVGELEPVLAG